MQIENIFNPFSTCFLPFPEAFRLVFTRLSERRNHQDAALVMTKWGKKRQGKVEESYIAAATGDKNGKGRGKTEGANS